MPSTRPTSRSTARAARLYTLYPFLALTVDMLALHLVAGFAGERIRPRLTVFCCGAGAVLSMISLPGVPEIETRIFLAAMAVQLFSHAVTLLTPREFEPADFTEAPDAPAEDAPAEAPEEAEPVSEEASEEADAE